MGVSLEQWRASLGGSSGVLKKHQDSCTAEFYGLVVATLLVAAGIEPNPGPNIKAACDLCGQLLEAQTGNVVQEKNDLKMLKDQLENVQKLLTVKGEGQTGYVQEKNDLKMLKDQLENLQKQLTVKEELLDSKMAMFCERESFLSHREESMNKREKQHYEMVKEFVEEFLKVEHSSQIVFNTAQKISKVTINDPKAPLTLHEAIKKGHLEEVRKVLLTGGVSVNHRYEDGKTPVLLASILGHLHVVRFLIQDAGAQKDAVDNELGGTALHWAVKSYHVSVVEYLVKEASMDVSLATFSGDTPLHMSAENGYFDIVCFLVKEGNAEVNVKNNNGDTPLHVAVKRGYIGIVSFLVENNKQVILIKNDEGMNPIHVAVQSGQLQIVKHLCKNFNKDSPIGVDNKGWTALHYAYKGKHTSITNYLLNTVGVDQNAKDSLGYPASHYQNH